MMNGDLFVPEVPPFEIYKTCISHGHNKEQFATNAIGIKCAMVQAKLLKEFY